MALSIKQAIQKYLGKKDCFKITDKGGELVANYRASEKANFDQLIINENVFCVVTKNKRPIEISYGELSRLNFSEDDEFSTLSIYLSDEGRVDITFPRSHSKDLFLFWKFITA